jgi:hypothetical protein
MPTTPFQGSLVTRSTDLSVADDDFQLVTWDTVEYDEGDFYDAGATDRFTIPADGYYLFGCMGRWDAANNTGGPGVRGIGIWLNADDPTLHENIGYNEWPAFTQAGAYMFQTPIGPARHLETGDYIRMYAYQSSSGALDLMASQGKTPAMWIVRVG